MAILPVHAFQHSVATVINRLSEEFNLRDFVVLTRRELVSDVLNSLKQYDAGEDANILIDYMLSGSLLKDNVFEDSFIMDLLLSRLVNHVKTVYIDLTMTNAAFAIIARSLENRYPSARFIYTHVDSIPLPGVPQYPYSPKWMHKVYVQGIQGSGDNALSSSADRVDTLGAVEIKWSSTKGLFEQFSKLFNAVNRVRLVEALVEGRRQELSEDHLMTIYAINTRTGERRKFIEMNLREGPDEQAVNMMMANWKVLTELLGEQEPGMDKSVLERILKQYQRYTGAVDLVIREISGKENVAQDFEGWKLHGVFIEMVRRTRRPVAILPDTNLFYQGLHLTFLKASIKSGAPWSPVENVKIYVPACAEAEINGKITESSGNATGLARYYYIMALLAHRALNEIKSYYKAGLIPAVSQPCEASIAAMWQSLPEEKVLLITADKKAFTAWNTLNVCNDEAICIYAGHRNKPLNVDSLYSKLYATIVLFQQIYVASVFTPLELRIGKKVLYSKTTSLEGSASPVILLTERQSEPPQH